MTNVGLSGKNYRPVADGLSENAFWVSIHQVNSSNLQPQGDEWTDSS